MKCQISSNEIEADRDILVVAAVRQFSRTPTLCHIQLLIGTPFGCLEHSALHSQDSTSPLGKPHFTFVCFVCRDLFGQL